MKRLEGTVCLFGVFALLVGIFKSAQAELVTHNFTGTVTFVSGTPFGLSLSAGEPIQGSFSYDTSLPPNFDTGSVAGYIQPPPSGMSVVIADTTIQSAGNASYQMLNNAFGTDNINGFFTPVSGYPSGSINFGLWDFTQNVFSSTALPSNLNAGDFSQRIGGASGGGGSLNFSIDTLEKESVAIQVAIDVKPGGFPNAINPNSNGVIAVAVLTTDAFDATTVDPSTVHFGKTGTEANPERYALEDIDLNGDLDLILHFQTQDTGIACGDTSAFLTGETFDDEMIEGTDYILTVACQ